MRTFLLAFLLALPARAMAQDLDMGVFDLSANGQPVAALALWIDDRGEVLIPIDTVTALLKLDAVDVDDRHSIHQDVRLVTRGVLSELLGAKVTVDFASLTLAIDRDTPFLFEVEAARERNRPRAAAPVRVAPAIAYGNPSGGAVLDWSANLTPERPSSAVMRGRLGAAVLGGQLTLDYAGAPFAERGYSNHRASWLRRYESPFLRWVEAGDLYSVVARSGAMQGARITNAGRQRQEFGELEFRPDVPIGWEYDVVANGVLVASGRGGEAVRIDAKYGVNSVEITAYNPTTGEAITTRKNLSVGARQVRRGHVEYTAEAGRCESPTCSITTAAEVRYGLANWLAVGAGTSWVDGTSSVHGLRARWSATVAPLAGWELHTEGTDRGDLLVSARATHKKMSGMLSGSSVADRWNGAGYLSMATGWRGPWVPTSLAVTSSISGAAALQDTRLGLRGMYREGHAEVYSQTSPWGDAQGVSLAYRPTRGARWMRGQSLSLDANRDREGLAYASALVNVRTGDYRTSITVGPTWSRHMGTGLSLTLSTLTRNVRAEASAAMQGGYRSSTVGASGAIGVDRRAGMVNLLQSGINELGGVSGRVYRDLDGDGRWSPGDEPVAGARVRVGHQVVVTNQKGVYHAWGLRAYDAASAVVEEGSLLDPFWTLETKEQWVKIAPAMFRSADFALVQTVEVTGSILPTRGVMRAGVAIELVNQVSGEVLRTRTFSDGTYYLSAVKPGRYEVRIADEALRALGVQAAPLQVSVGAVAFVEIDPISMIAEEE